LDPLFAASTTVEFPSSFPQLSPQAKLAHVVEQLTNVSQQSAKLIAQQRASELSGQKQTEAVEAVSEN
jgi:hypothetical protein